MSDKPNKKEEAAAAMLEARDQINDPKTDDTVNNAVIDSK